ncbi:MAG: chemotaxis response regulator protein-glutamate methylesterase [Bacteroidetes bacterium]|nr:chemotaxis response regulator protein-glutamate methylesterase [Bacteroidota bacterium]MBU1115161.1 chemotaxis response regulator protein-glutamate methylesterase [Bacteroidota bacterium]MBU1799332.1 chemotaxis response regulator protein-glutamate methylesterase [Bacteroidota bacterium]
MKKKIKVLIVDDSAFMRKSLSIMLSGDPNIEICGTAKNGQEGYDLAKELRPDLITLDVEMPVMDGLTALKLIMKDAPTSVIMVSSITTEGAESTIKAFEYGAVDFISKEQSFVSVNITKIKDELIRKIKSIVYHKRTTTLATSKSLNSHTDISENVSKGVLPRIGYTAIAIGVSTGGPISLQKVIPQLSENLNVPVFIVQHMPPKFTKSLADRLNNMSKLAVKEAEHGDLVTKNTVYIAPGGKHINFVNVGHTVKIILTDQPEKSLHRPSVDVMLHSAISIYGKNLLSVIMTGMGKDGLLGIEELNKLGGKCLAQNEHTCVVYGMPKAVVDAGYADSIAPLGQIAYKINSVF